MTRETDVRASAIIAGSLPARAAAGVLAAIGVAWAHSWTRDRLAADAQQIPFWVVAVATAALVVLARSWMGMAGL